MMRRTATTIVSLSVIASAAYFSIRTGSPIPLFAVCILVLLFSFFETVAFVKRRWVSTVFLFLACVSTFVALTFLTSSPQLPVNESFVVLSSQSLLFLLGGAILFFLSLASLWKKVNFRDAPVSSGWTAITWLYYGFFAAFILRILLEPSYIIFDPDRLFGHSDNAVAAGVYFFLLSVLTGKFTDIGAFLGGYFFGKKLFGGRKMAPRISPKKTQTGLLFGVLSAGLVGFLGLYLNPFGAINPVIAVVFGPVIGLATVGGDLFESLAKRSFNLKDSGKFLPGIGGWFDLTDSLFWAGPTAYFFLILNFHVLQ